MTGGEWVAIAMMIVSIIVYIVMAETQYGGDYKWGIHMIQDLAQTPDTPNVDPCPDGYFLRENECFPVNDICPEGYFLLNNECQPKPPIVNEPPPEDECQVACVEGQGYVQDCECKCFGGYTGADCGQRDCPSRDCGNGTVGPDCQCDCSNIDCENSGFTSPDCTCVCPTGYSGSRCEIVDPNLLCGDVKCFNGELDQNCKCNCDPDYVGDDCRCKNKNCGSGTQNPNTCQCDCSRLSPCQNNGYRDPNNQCKCVCGPGYSGDVCQFVDAGKACQGLPCDSMGGEILANPCRCQCRPGYLGTDCSCRDRDCGNGYLDPNSCQCVCSPGWKGANCMTRDCSYKYCGQGTQDPNTCQCDCSNVPCVPGQGSMSSSCQCNCYSGFQGLDCSERVCPSQYCGRGTLNRNTCQCECPSGYSGDQCQFENPTVICQNTPCQNGTIKSNPCRCECNYGWSGPDCSIPNPELLCQGTPCYNGDLVYPCGCKCSEGFFGFGCTSRDCSKAGPNGGPVQCEWGTINTDCECECWPTYKGSTCGERDCSSNPCVNGEYDDLCNCICDPGFSGTDCSRRDCSGTRCQFGTVNRQTCECECDPGFTGRSCLIIEDPNNRGHSLDYQECIIRNDTHWTGYQCIKNTGKCPMSGPQVCMNWGGFNYVHSADSDYNWECALGDERNGGIIGDSVDYALGGKSLKVVFKL